VPTGSQNGSRFGNLDPQVRGLTNREIAAQLYLSARTVETHVDHILTKLSLSTRTQLVARAHEEGLLPGNR
jgi:DNA-binding NarL/FixJ family response regulator